MQLFFFPENAVCCALIIIGIYLPTKAIISPWWAFFGLFCQLLANLLMQEFQLPSAEPHIGRAEEHMVLATIADYPHVVFLLYHFFCPKITCTLLAHLPK